MLTPRIQDIYDQIFSLEGGIYERCITSISYEMPHRINEIKEQILRLLLPVTDRKYVMEGMILHKLSDYIRLGQWGNYSKLFLAASDLRGMKLHEQKLEMVCLRKADLEEADLRGAEVRGIQLDGANLKGTIFDERQIAQIEHMNCSLQDVKIYADKENDFISFDEYCKRRNG